MKFGSLEELYKTDEDKSNKGIPVTVGMNEKNDPIIMVVAEAGSKLHKKVQRKYDRALEASRRNPDKRRYILSKIISESLLKGWSGVLDSKGNEVPYTVENGIEALMKYEQLSIEVMEAATDIENFRPEGIEETEKN